MNRILHKLKLPVVLMMLFCTVSVSLVQGQTWTGAVSSDWNTAGNWTGGVPVASSDITIPGSLSVYPVIGVAGDCNSITLGNGASISGIGTLSIGASSTITTNGTTTISCPLSLSAPTTFDITGQLTISDAMTGIPTVEMTTTGTGDLILGNLITDINSLTIISGTVYAGADLTIFDALTIDGVMEMGTYILATPFFDFNIYGAGQLRTANISSTPIPSKVWGPKVVYNNATGGQTIPQGVYNGGLLLNNTSGTQNAGANISGFIIEMPNSGTTLLMNNRRAQFSAYSLVTGATLNMGTGVLVTPAIFTSMLGTVRFSGASNGIAIASGTVEYYGLIAQTVANGIYQNLVINKISGNATLSASGASTVNGMLTLTSGTLIIGNNTLFANGGIIRTSGNLGGSSSSNLTLGGTTGNSKALYFNSSFASLRRLTLGHTATSTTTTLNTPLSIHSGVVIGSSNDILNLTGQNLILKSTADSTAFIGQLPTGSLINASNITAERFIPANRAWRILTIPVTGQTIHQAWMGASPNPAAPAGETAGSGTLITGNNYTVGATAAAAGYDWFSGLGATTTSSIRFYTPTNAWASATNTPLTSAAGNSKEGFMLYVRGDRTVTGSTGVGSTTLKPTGAIRQGTVTVPIAATDSFSVVGNPYPASINLNDVFNNSGNAAAIKRNFWVWDARAGSSGAYAILSWDGVSAYTLSGASGSTINEYLTVNSGQAFFVEKFNIGGNINILESNKTNNAPAALLRPVGNNGVSKIGITLYKAVGSVLGEQADNVTARYNDIYQQAGTETFDAVKLNNFNENLSLVRNNRYLSIESRPFPTQNDTLYIPFWNLAQRDYAFEITSSKFIGVNQTARLIDAFTNTERIIDLFDGTITYPFTVTSDAASSSLTRFKIVMAPAVVLAVNCTKFDASLIGKKVKLSWSTGCEVGAKNFVVERSANGINFSKIDSVVAKNSATGASYQLFDNQPINGKNFYRIRSNDKAGHFVYTSIALIQLNGKKDIQVIPTIIDNKHFTLTLNQQPLGKYNLSLSNVAGQQVFQTSVSNTGMSSTHQIDLSNGMVPKGIYHLSVTDEQGNKQNIRLLINN